METGATARSLLQEADNFHRGLVNQAREVSRFRELLVFLVQCLDFIETHLPDEIGRPWLATNQHVPLLAQRAAPLFHFESPDPLETIYLLNTTGSSATSDAFTLITDNFNFLEDSQSRSDYYALAGTYRDLLAGPQQQEEVHLYLAPLNVLADSKFTHSINAFRSLPSDEDPQGPLMEMRSAIDETVRTLLSLTPLTNREQGDLKAVSVVPTVAQYLAKNAVAKLDLLLANDRFQRLMGRLSASKNAVITRAQADALMNEAIALLNLLSRTLPKPGSPPAPAGLIGSA